MDLHSALQGDVLPINLQSSLLKGNYKKDCQIKKIIMVHWDT